MRNRRKSKKKWAYIEEVSRAETKQNRSNKTGHITSEATSTSRSQFKVDRKVYENTNQKNSARSICSVELDVFVVPFEKLSHKSFLPSKSGNTLTYTCIAQKSLPYQTNNKWYGSFGRWYIFLLWHHIWLCLHDDIRWMDKQQPAASSAPTNRSNDRPVFDEIGDKPCAQYYWQCDISTDKTHTHTCRPFNKVAISTYRLVHIQNAVNICVLCRIKKNSILQYS